MFENIIWPFLKVKEGFFLGHPVDRKKMKQKNTKIKAKIKTKSDNYFYHKVGRVINIWDVIEQGQKRS